MTDQDDDTVELPDTDYLDPIAARAEAYGKLLSRVNGLIDAELRKEGVLMLRALRLSFKTLPQGDGSVLALVKPAT